MQSGIPTIAAYRDLLRTDSFLELESFSEDFIRRYKSCFPRFSLRWTADSLHVWSRQWEYPFVLQAISEKRGTDLEGEYSVLDAGSGITFFPYYLSERGIEVTCCDRDRSLAASFAAVNENRTQTVAFRTEDLRKMTFPDSSFDALYCISVLEHTGHFKEILQEFSRVLKPRGTLVLTFDISLDGKRDIPIHVADELLHRIGVYFDPCSTEEEVASLSEVCSNPEIVSTGYFKTGDRHLLPWNWLFFTKCLMMGRKPSVPNLTFYCQVYEKR